MLGNSAAFRIVGRHNLLETLSAIVDLFPVAFIESHHRLFILKADAAEVIVVIKLLSGYTIPRLRIDIVGMDRNTKKPVLTVGIITQQTERITVTGLTESNSETDGLPIIEDGLDQTIPAFLLTLIDGYGIPNMRIIITLDSLVGQQPLMVICILGDDNSQLLLFFNSLFITVDISDHRICNLTQLILGITLIEKLPFKPGGNLVPETCRSLMRDVQLPSQHFLCHQGGDFFHAVRNIDTHHWIVILKHPEEIVCRSIYVFLLRLLRLRLSSLSIELLGYSSCILLSQIPDMGYSHVITDSFDIGHIIPIGIVAIIVLVLCEHDTTAALTVNDIKEGYSLLVQLIPDLLTLHFPIVLSGLQGFILLFVQNLTDIFRNIHLHDVPIQVELAIYIHRGSLADVDIRGDNTVGKILDEGFSIFIGQQTGNLSVIADACEEIPGLLLCGKGLLKGRFLLSSCSRGFNSNCGLFLLTEGILAAQGVIEDKHLTGSDSLLFRFPLILRIADMVYTFFKKIKVSLTDGIALRQGEHTSDAVLCDPCCLTATFLITRGIPLVNDILNVIQPVAGMPVKAALLQEPTGQINIKPAFQSLGFLEILRNQILPDAHIGLDKVFGKDSTTGNRLPGVLTGLQ